MAQKLSKRLQAAADFVTPGNRVADVGTDHGHLLIYLIQCGRCPSAVAMDIRSGPLQQADGHIKASGLTGSIQTRLSDGMKKLMPGEADSVVIAGMGGLTIIQILESSPDIVRDVSELILSPQSDAEKVRRLLREQGLIIDRENLVLEDGKFYPVLHVVKDDTGTYQTVLKSKYEKMKQLFLAKLKSSATIINQQETQAAARFWRVMDQYGACLVYEKHPVLIQMLKRDGRQKQKILQALESSTKREESSRRRMEVEEQLDDLGILLEIMESV